MYNFGNMNRDQHQGRDDDSYGTEDYSPPTEPMTKQDAIFLLRTMAIVVVISTCIGVATEFLSWEPPFRSEVLFWVFLLGQVAFKR